MADKQVIKIKTDVLLKGLKAVNAVINNSSISVINKYLNLVAFDSTVYAVGLGERRVVTYKLVDDYTGDDFVKHVKYGQLAQPLSMLSASLDTTIDFDLSDDNQLLIQSGDDIKLNLMCYVADDSDFFIKDLPALLKPAETAQTSTLVTKEYANLLNVLSTMSTSGKDMTASEVSFQPQYAYIQSNQQLVSRLAYNTKVPYTLSIPDVSVVSTLLGVTTEDNITISLDVEQGGYLVTAGAGTYTLTGGNFYFNENIANVIDDFESEYKLKFSAKEFVQALKLANIYLSDADTAILKVADGKLVVLPGNAYNEFGNDITTSYSEMNMPVTSSADSIMVAVPLDPVLSSMGVVTDMTGLSEIDLDLADDRGEFSFNGGAIVIGMTVMEQDETVEG